MVVLPEHSVDFIAQLMPVRIRIDAGQVRQNRLFCVAVKSALHQRREGARRTPTASARSRAADVRSSPLLGAPQLVGRLFGVRARPPSAFAAARLAGK